MRILNNEKILDLQFYLDKFTEGSILKGSKRVAKAQYRQDIKDFIGVLVEVRGVADIHYWILENSTLEFLKQLVEE